MENIKCKTFTEVLKSKGENSDSSITFYSSNGEQKLYSYKQLHQGALKVLGYLQSQKVEKGNKVLVQATNNLDFIFSVWACLLGGYVVIPVPCSEKALDKQRVLKVIKSMDQVTVLCSSNEMNVLGDADSDIVEKVKLVTSLQDAFLFDTYGVSVDLEEEDIAMIQFSSGSTSDPKGVVLTQKNLMCNITSIAERIEGTKQDSIFLWIPLTHDMGLIGGHFTAIYIDMNQYIMQTDYFLKNPIEYLKEVSLRKATILIMPNFGFQYILQAVQAAGEIELDFSVVRIIFNGAEPISLDVCETFNKVFQKYHLPPNTLLTVYGLAEATLAVAFPKINTPIESVCIERHNMQIGEPVQYKDKNDVENGITVVSEGYLLSDLDCKICDLDEMELGEDQFGQIMLKGPTIMKEYYNNEEMTRKKLSQDGWLKTGDLGFINQGKLFVLGRQEELIIINGQNYMSYDLENIIRSLDFMKQRKIAVLSVYHPGKKSDILLCCIEKKDDSEITESVADQVKKKFYEFTGLLLDSVVEIEQIPKTVSGKIKRFELKRKIEAEYDEVKRKKSTDDDKADADSVTVHKIEERLEQICMEIIPGYESGANFTDYNISSVLIMKLHSRICEEYPGTIGIEELFNVQELSSLATKISKSYQKTENVETSIENKGILDDVAIVGMALRVPGANDLSSYWENINMGIESIGTLQEKRKELFGMDVTKDCPRGGYIDDIQMFDNHFFGILDREAIAMPPSQRLFLEVTYETIEDAGYTLSELTNSNTGVFVGYISESDNACYQQLLKSSKDKQTATGALAANISGRISYTFDLRGESLNVDSACSSSGSALYHAYQSVRSGESEQAIVGGIQLDLMPSEENNIGIESKQGHICTFDNVADGTCKGEGVVSIFIKPYQKALRDKDHIYAVISSVTMNQDGKTKGLSVPNPEAQKNLILKTLGRAGVTSKDVQYIEAHGTGTNIGDPIELNTLAKVFHGQGEEPCYVGCVKPNIGHLYAASGLAAVAKCCLMLEKKRIPQLINFQSLNEKINIDTSSLIINTENRTWDTEKARRCLISNYGFSGTNCSILLSEAESEVKEQSEKEGTYLFCLSGKTRTALNNLINKYRIFTIDTEESIANICYSTLCRREHYEYRIAFLVKTVEELHDKLVQYSGCIGYSQDIYVGHVRTLKAPERKNLRIKHDEVEILSRLCDDVIQSYKENNEQSLLRKMAEFYVKGAEADWKKLYEKEKVHNVSLPTICFDKKPFWPRVM